MEPAIRVENLGKRYRISHEGAGHGQYKTLRDSLMGMAKAPFRKLRGVGGGEGGREDFWALKDVSFEVQPGEVVGIIGRNGAGKSTLLKILSRITKPTSGEIKLRGRVGSLLEVGTGFHQELTGRENIYLNGSILGMSHSEIEARFDEIVAFSEIEKFLDTPVKRYSSGMYVRLAFAVAAHLEPEILVVDEVLAVGDAEFQRKCLGKMQQVAEGCGRTILFVSHNMAAVTTLCHRAIVLRRGQAVFDGNTRAGIREYLRSREIETEEGTFLQHNIESMSENGCICEARVTSGGEFSSAGYSTGRPLEFTVRCVSRRRVVQPRLGIGIDNSTGQRIVTLHTEHAPSARSWRGVEGEFTFRCEPKLPALMPDTYTVKLAFEDGTDAIDVQEGALQFIIEDDDVYGNAGKRHSGVILCPEEWTLTVQRSDSARVR